MILADTSVWIDYFRLGNSALESMLEADEILMHPFVLGELMLGGLHLRQDAFMHLRGLPGIEPATSDEVAMLIEIEQLQGQGIGYVDTALLASVRLQPGARLWTHDRRLAERAAAMGIGASEA